jgi:hypothetical protein
VEEVVFYNQLGEIALQASFNGVQSAYMDIQQLNQGVYLCHLHTKNGTIVRKLTKL